MGLVTSKASNLKLPPLAHDHFDFLLAFFFGDLTV